MANSVSLPTKTVTIDSETYTITTLDAVTARPIVVRLMKTLGAGLEGIKNVEDEASIYGILGRILQALPEDLVNDMASIYAKSCEVHKGGDKTPKVSEQYMFHFAGRPAHWLKWMIECTKVNFADFLDGSTGLSLNAFLVKPSK